MRIGNRCSKIFTAIIVCGMLAAVVMAGNSREGQLSNLLLQSVGEKRTAEIMALPRISDAPFLLVAPDLRFAVVCDYHAGGDSVKVVEVIFDYRGKK